MFNWNVKSPPIPYRDLLIDYVYIDQSKEDPANMTFEVALILEEGIEVLRTEEELAEHGLTLAELESWMSGG